MAVNRKFEREVKEFEEKVVQIDRVTRVVKGGRRLRFRATVVIGDRKGRVGIGVAKASQVVLAITKAVSQAKKNLVIVNLHETTIPHEVTKDYCGAKVFLKPAKPGTGVIAGGAVRAVVEAAGITDILSKMIGSSNKINNVYATFYGLTSMSPRPERAKSENKSPVKEVKQEKKAEAQAEKTIEKPAEKKTAKKAVSEPLKAKKSKKTESKK